MVKAITYVIIAAFFAIGLLLGFALDSPKCPDCECSVPDCICEMPECPECDSSTVTIYEPCRYDLKVSDTRQDLEEETGEEVFVLKSSRTCENFFDTRDFEYEVLKYVDVDDGCTIFYLR